MRSLFTSIIIALLISCTVVYGQSGWERDADYYPRSEIYIQYGAPTILELTSTLQNPVFGDGIKAESKHPIFTGVGGIGYNFSINEIFALGIYGGLSYSRADIYLDPSTSSVYPQTLYQAGIRSYVGQLSGQWVYYQDGPLELSSALYLGVAYRDETIYIKSSSSLYEKSIPAPYDRLNFAYHFTAVKVRYGETLGLFGELGFGYRGLVNVGLSVKL